MPAEFPPAFSVRIAARLIEGVPNSDLDLEDVWSSRGWLEGFVDKLTVDHLQSVQRSPQNIDARVGQKLAVASENALTDAPVLVQKISEIDDVHSELQAVSPAGQIGKNLLLEAQVGPFHHWEEHSISLCVLPAVIFHVVVLLNEGLPRCCLIGGGKDSDDGTGR